MTVEAPNIAPESPAPRSRPRANLGRDLVIILLLVAIAALVAWQAGLFRSKPRIAIISSTDSPYWDPVFAGAQRAAQQCDAELTVERFKASDAQVQGLKDLLGKGVNGFAVSPIDPDGQASFLSDVSQKSKLITIDSDCAASNRAAFIGTDNYLAGRRCAELIRDAIPDGGEIIISVGSVTKENGRLRRQGLVDDLLDRPVDPNRPGDPLDAPLTGKQYSVVATLIDDVDPAKATSLAIDAIKQHPDVKCLVGLFGYSTPALLDALKQADKLGKIKIVGFDNAEATLAGIENGTVSATLVQDQYSMGFDSVVFLCQLINGNQRAQPVARQEFLACDSISNPQDVKLYRLQQQRQQSGTAN